MESLLSLVKHPAFVSLRWLDNSQWQVVWWLGREHTHRITRGNDLDELVQDVLRQILEIKSGAEWLKPTTKMKG